MFYHPSVAVVTNLSFFISLCFGWSLLLLLLTEVVCVVYISFVGVVFYIRKKKQLCTLILLIWLINHVRLN